MYRDPAAKTSIRPLASADRLRICRTWRVRRIDIVDSSKDQTMIESLSSLPRFKQSYSRRQD